MSRTPHQPTEKTRAEVMALAGYGVTEDEISKYIGVAPKTLRKWYREELDIAHIKANAAVARALYKKAVDEGHPTAIIFWLKSRAGWKETSVIEGVGFDAPSIVINRPSGD